MGVECARRLVLVLEVDVDVPVIGERDKALREGFELCRGVATVATETEADVGARGVDLRGCEVVTFGDAEGGVCRAKKVVGLAGEPGVVAELEGNRRGIGGGESGRAEKLGEAIGIGFEVGRELKEKEAELAGLPDWFKRGDELLNLCGAVAQAAEVSDALGGLEAETEVLRCDGEPAFDHLGRGQGTEGVVDFDRGEPGGVEAQEVFLREARRVEARLPGWVGPAGGAGEESRDYGTLRRRQWLYRLCRSLRGSGGLGGAGHLEGHFGGVFWGG